jgi:hypothetical protein
MSFLLFSIFVQAGCCVALGILLLGRQEQQRTEIAMRLSEIKAQIAEAAAKSAEAFAELGTRIGDLQRQVDELVAAASDPDVTDTAFLADLNTVRSNVASLAEIVPNPAPPAPEPANN